MGLKEGRKAEFLFLEAVFHDLVVVAAEVDNADLAVEVGHVFDDFIGPHLFEAGLVVALADFF